jgi:hypothetical protein
MMHFPKYLLLAACGIAVTLSGCDESTVINSNADLKGTVILYVVDGSSGLPLEQVKVELTGVGTRNTEGGHAVFTDVKAGNYFVRLTKEDYEPMQQLVEAPFVGTEQVVAVNTSMMVSLNKQGVTLRGRVLLTNATGDSTVPADSVTVHLWSSPLDGNYLTPMRTAVTSSTGWYEFTDLPERSEYALEVPEFSRRGRAYRQDYDVVGESGNLIAGAKPVVADPTVLIPFTGGSLSAFVRSNVLVAGQPLQVEFSAPLDASKLFSGSTPSIQLRMTPPNAATVSIAALLTWNSDLTVLSIRPYQSEWMAGASYSVNLTAVRSTDGASLTTTLGGAVLPSAINLTAVQGLRLRATTSIRGTAFDTAIVDYATSPYRLSWNRVAGSEGYAVYYRQSVDSAWQLRVSTATQLSTDTTVSMAPLGAGGKAWTRYLMVVPVSSTKFVQFTLGALMTVRDGVRPSMNTTASTLTVPGGTSFAPTAAARVVPITLNISMTASQNDPLDTTRRPTVRVGNGGLPGTGTATFVWTSLLGGRVDFSLAANADARQDTVVLNFAPVTDLAGNPVDTLPNAPVLRYLVPLLP